MIDSVPMIFSQGENPCDGDDDDGDDGDDDVVCENSCDETSSHQSISYNIELQPFLDMVVVLDTDETDASNRTVGVDRMDSHYNAVSERAHNKMDIHDDYDDGDDGGGDVYGSDEDSQDSHDCQDSHACQDSHDCHDCQDSSSALSDGYHYGYPDDPAGVAGLDGSDCPEDPVCPKSGVGLIGSVMSFFLLSLNSL